MITTAVFDIGNVIVQFRPRAAFAGHLDDEAVERFLVEIDFPTWNRQQDAGRTFAEAEACLARDHPHYRHLAGVYRENFHRATEVEVPGTAAILRDLAGAGIRLLSLTNFPAELFPPTRQRFEILELFEGIVVSGVERVVKPDPAIYRLLLDRYGVEARDCVFIDDSEPNVLAARALGMRGILFTGAGSLQADLAELGLLP